MSRAESETIELEPTLIYLRREGKDRMPTLCVLDSDGAPLKLYALNPERIKRLLADLAEYNRSL